ncbi:hypothetical protein ACFV94_09035 [Streptomyces sp. NPDC059896]|uniref:hypothetical protein n=2 Tax=unclassified Streptomyces TaxID=2593676 RepID=UPI00365E5356
MYSEALAAEAGFGTPDEMPQATVAVEQRFAQGVAMAARPPAPHLNGAILAVSLVSLVRLVGVAVVAKAALRDDADVVVPYVGEFHAPVEVVAGQRE